MLVANKFFLFVLNFDFYVHKSRCKFIFVPFCYLRFTPESKLQSMLLTQHLSSTSSNEIYLTATSNPLNYT